MSEENIANAWEVSGTRVFAASGNSVPDVAAALSVIAEQEIENREHITGLSMHIWFAVENLEGALTVEAPEPPAQASEPRWGAKVKEGEAS